MEENRNRQGLKQTYIGNTAHYWWKYKLVKFSWKKTLTISNWKCINAMTWQFFLTNIWNSYTYTKIQTCLGMLIATLFLLAKNWKLKFCQLKNAQIVAYWNNEISYQHDIKVKMELHKSTWKVLKNKVDWKIQIHSRHIVWRHF